MNQIIEVRANVLYNKVKEDGGDEKFKPCFELIFISVEPHYSYTNDMQIVKSLELEDITRTNTTMI